MREQQEPVVPFWQDKTLDQLSASEWEALCDGCGRCCLHKLEDEDTAEVCYTKVACRLLDTASCRCTNYERRHEEVAACLPLSRQTMETMSYMPATCAYRLRAEGKPLPDWHPLVSGDPASVHAAGISVRGKAISEQGFEGDLEDYVINGFA